MRRATFVLCKFNDIKALPLVGADSPHLHTYPKTRLSGVIPGRRVFRFSMRQAAGQPLIHLNDTEAGGIILVLGGELNWPSTENEDVEYRTIPAYI